jgi:glycosyltransferase involved in cell wall biosynthesis
MMSDPFIKGCVPSGVVPANGMPLTVAAVIPLYNNRDTVVEAIDSVLAQTRPVDEIIVVDDGSTDGSADIVAARFGERVQLIRQANGGPSAARNTAIRASHADLITFLDADDLWLPTHIEKQAALMETHLECMLSFTSHLIWNEHRNEMRIENASINKATFLRRDFFQERLHIATNTVMVRRVALEQTGLFDETLMHCEDADLWLRIMVRFHFVHLPEPLAWVRRTVAHQDQLMQSRSCNLKWLNQYFAKHRFTFGRGIGGRATWRAAYGSVLRREAGLALRAGQQREALNLLIKGFFVWPFVRSGYTLRIAMKLLLGNRLYEGCVSTAKRVRGRLGA